MEPAFRSAHNSELLQKKGGTHQYGGLDSRGATLAHVHVDILSTVPAKDKTYIFKYEAERLAPLGKLPERFKLKQHRGRRLLQNPIGTATMAVLKPERFQNHMHTRRLVKKPILELQNAIAKALHTVVSLSSRHVHQSSH